MKFIVKFTSNAQKLKLHHDYIKKKEESDKTSTCNCSASERERICLLADRALPKSINMARGGCPFL